MKGNLLVILLLFAGPNLFSQQTKRSGRLSSWRDTTYIPVVLRDSIVDSKVASVNIGKKAIIYIKLKPLLAEAKENLTNEFVRTEYNAIIHFLDSASLKGDTIFIDDYYNLSHFEYLVSSQLIEGNAKVLYKRQKSFVDTISHRLERYGGNADRFFYLADKRPFFAVNELSGILDNNHAVGSGQFQAYVKEGEKLASVRKE
jgi:hypothetical protein